MHTVCVYSYVFYCLPPIYHLKHHNVILQMCEEYFGGRHGSHYNEGTGGKHSFHYFQTMHVVTMLFLFYLLP